MILVRCVKSISALLFSQLLVSSVPCHGSGLPAPNHRKAQEYNYSNGEVGSNALGLSSADAADYNEVDIPLAPPTLKSTELNDSAGLALEIEKLDGEKNSQECLNSCNK